MDPDIIYVTVFAFIVPISGLINGYIHSGKYDKKTTLKKWVKYGLIVGLLSAPLFFFISYWIRLNYYKNMIRYPPTFYLPIVFSYVILVFVEFIVGSLIGHFIGVTAHFLGGKIKKEPETERASIQALDEPEKKQK